MCRGICKGSRTKFKIVAKGYAADEVFSGDETGMLFGAPPLKQYVPLSSERATAPESDDKARFTSFLYGNAAGKMKKSFNIVKCQSQSPYDLGGTRVLQNMHKKDARFSSAAGWTMERWSRSLMLPAKKNEAPSLVNCVRPYLKHSDGTIITVQNKAWMDSAGMVMMADVQIGPMMRKTGRRVFMVWDNCGPHKVAAVQEAYAAWGIDSDELPAKMTDILQVMDLIANGPLKAAIRRRRTKGLFAYFQSWKLKRLSAHVKGEPLPPFQPPKPKLADGIEALLACLDTSLATPEFEDSMRRTFVKVGLWKKQTEDEFVVYVAHSKLGLLDQVLPSTEVAVRSEHRQVGRGDDEVVTSFGEIAAEVIMVRQEEDEEAAAEPEDEEDEDDGGENEGEDEDE